MKPPRRYCRGGSCYLGGLLELDGSFVRERSKLELDQDGVQVVGTSVEAAGSADLHPIGIGEDVVELQEVPRTSISLETDRCGQAVTTLGGLGGDLDLLGEVGSNPGNVEFPGGTRNRH